MIIFLTPAIAILRRYPKHLQYVRIAAPRQSLLLKCSTFILQHEENRSFPQRSGNE